MNPDSPENSPAPSPAAGRPPDDSRGEDIVVFISRHVGRCAECDEEFHHGSFIRVEADRRNLCLDCADLGWLEYLPRGDTALTRRATKHSPLRAVVVQWSRSRQRFERQGILAAPDAIRQAEVEVLADADVRARARERAAVRREAQEPVYVAQVSAALRSFFPRIPPDAADAIAAWTCQKYSGRVGRSAGAKELEREPLRLAAIAHIRHVHTPYDKLLMRHGDRHLARQAVRAEIDRILAEWERPL